MYFFKPVLLSEETKNKNGVLECTFKYDGYSSDKLEGFCEGEIQGNYVTVTNISFSQDKPDFCEGLLRAALNFGANRGAYMAKCDCKNSVEVMKLMGFEKSENGFWEGDIPTLLAGSCSQCGK